MMRYKMKYRDIKGITTTVESDDSATIFNRVLQEKLKSAVWFQLREEGRVIDLEEFMRKGVITRRLTSDVPDEQFEMFAKPVDPEGDKTKKGFDGQIRRLFTENRNLNERVKLLEGQVKFLMGKAVGKGKKEPTMCGEHAIPMKWRGNKYVCEMCGTH